MKQRPKNRGSRALTRATRAPTNRGKSAARGFAALVQMIAKTHSHFAARTSLAINAGLTLRNWSIGCHIREFEQRGAKRATYGTGLFEKLSARLQENKGIKYHPRELRRCRQFYDMYPQIWGAVPPESRQLLISELPRRPNFNAVKPRGMPGEHLLRSLRSPASALPHIDRAEAREVQA